MDGVEDVVVEGAVEERVAELESALAEAQAALATSERQRVIAGALADAGALDVETAALLVERAMVGEEAVDVTEIVRDLKKRKSHLFRSATVGAAQAVMDEGAPDALLEAAAHAAEAGDRVSLLRYLRLRRMG